MAYKYSAQVLKRLEGCRARPRLYIAPVEQGVLQMLREVFYTCLEESNEDGDLSEITLKFCKDGYIFFQDNGVGMPLDKEGVSFLSRFPEVGRYSTDFAEDLYGCGVGLSVVNAFSSSFELTSYKDGFEYFAAFEKGEVVDGLTKVGPTRLKGSVIKFKPDETILKHNEPNLTECLELINELLAGLKVRVIDERTNFSKIVNVPSQSVISSFFYFLLNIPLFCFKACFYCICRLFSAIRCSFSAPLTEWSIEASDGSSPLQVLKRLEACRARPDLYIGPVEQGVFQMFKEIFYMCLEEYYNGNGGCSEINIKFYQDGCVSFQDNGAGIPIDEEGIAFVSQFPEGGRHSSDLDGDYHYDYGIGISVVNALSSNLELKVYLNGFEYFAAFENGELVGDLRKIGPTKLKGTHIKFKPDETIFQNNEFNLSECLELLHELSEPGLKIHVIDERIDFSEMIFVPKEPEISYYLKCLKLFLIILIIIMGIYLRVHFNL